MVRVLYCGQRGASILLLEVLRLLTRPTACHSPCVVLLAVQESRKELGSGVYLVGSVEYDNCGTVQRYISSFGGEEVSERCSDT